MKPKSTLRSLLLGYALLASSTAFAADAAWNVDLDGSWGTDANWNPAAPGATTGTTSADVATFGTAITAARAITVDANRNIAGINFAGNSSAYTLSGGSILLTNAGTIQTSGAGSAHTDSVGSPIVIQGDGGAASITGGSSTATRLLSITGGITGVSTGTNVTTLTLNGTNTGANAVGGGIADGSGGGKLALVKSGAGQWVLSTADNTYSGGTTINAGTLTISTNGRLGDSEGDITFGGNAKLLVSANNVTLAGTRTVTVNSGVAVMGDNNQNANPLNFTIDGKITGAGGIQTGHYQLGTGVTNLNSTANDFTGPLILGVSSVHSSFTYSTFTLNVASLADGVGNGNIIFGRGNGTAGQTATLAWSDTATSALTLNNRRIELDTTIETSVLANNNATAANTVTVNTDLLVSRAGNKVFGLGGTNTGANTFSTVITDSVTPAATISLTKSGAGRWILTNANTYTGTTTVTGGLLVLNNANALPGGTGITGGTSNLTLNNGAVGLATGDFTRGLGTGADQVQFAAGISGFGAYGAPRTVTINNDSNFELVWGSAAFNPTSLALNVGNGVNNTLTLTNKIDLAGASRTIQTSINTGIVTGVIRNSGVAAAGLTKTGSGTLSLTNANTYDGATTVSGGVLKLDNANALPGGTGGAGTSNLTIAGGVLGLTAASGDFTRARGTGVAQVQWTGSGGFAAYGGNRTVNLAGTGATAQWNTSSFVPSGQRLILSAAGSDSTVTFANNLNFAGSVREIQVDNGSAAVDAILSGQIGLSGGQTGGLTKSGAGTLALTNNSTNSYTGTTTISAGTLQFGNGGSTGALRAIANTFSVSTGANVTVNRDNDFTQALDLNGRVISGAGNFAQIGTGTTTLSLSNTYTGTTSINAGTLVITGATQATSSISFGGAGVLGLDITTPVTAANAAVNLTGGTVLVTGTPVDPSYTLLTASSITPANPTLAVPVPGYILQVFGGNELRLIQSGSPVGYAAWQAANSTAGTRDQDHDGDGVDNGTEYFLGGPVNTNGYTTPLPGVDNTGGTLSVTWTKGPGYSGTYNTDYWVETSDNLAGPWNKEAPLPDVDITDTSGSVKYTFPSPLGTRKFARLVVVGP